jgi:hypothetical protein
MDLQYYLYLLHSRSHPLTLLEQQTPQASRTFVLISKLLQNLANGVRSGKEVYMKEVDSFLSDHLASVHKFFEQLCNIEKEIKFRKLASKDDVTQKELPKLHKFVVKNLEEIVVSLVKYQQAVRHLEGKLSYFLL